jgi:hypothetical protein
VSPLLLKLAAVRRIIEEPRKLNGSRSGPQLTVGTHGAGMTLLGAARDMQRRMRGLPMSYRFLSSRSTATGRTLRPRPSRCLDAFKAAGTPFIVGHPGGEWWSDGSWPPAPDALR